MRTVLEFEGERIELKPPVECPNCDRRAGRASGLSHGETCLRCGGLGEIDVDDPAHPDFGKV